MFNQNQIAIGHAHTLGNLINGRLLPANGKNLDTFCFSSFVDKRCLTLHDCLVMGADLRIVARALGAPGRSRVQIAQTGPLSATSEISECI